MAEYIEREAVLALFDLYLCAGETWVEINPVLVDVYALPSADVAPVVYGRWIDVREYCGDFMCFNCSALYGTNVFNYCPNCGARMTVTERSCDG